MHLLLETPKRLNLFFSYRFNIKKLPSGPVHVNSTATFAGAELSSAPEIKSGSFQAAAQQRRVVGTQFDDGGVVPHQRPRQRLHRPHIRPGRSSVVRCNIRDPNPGQLAGGVADRQDMVEGETGERRRELRVCGGGGGCR